MVDVGFNKHYSFNITTYRITQGEHEYAYGLKQFSLGLSSQGSYFDEIYVFVNGEKITPKNLTSVYKFKLLNYYYDYND